MAAWSWYGPGRLRAAARAISAGVGDALVVPPGPVLIGQLDELAVLIEPGRRPGPVQPDQGQQPGHLGLGGHELVEQRGEEGGVVGEVAGLGLSAPAGQVALVEQQVDDGQDLGQADTEFVGGRDSVRDARVSDLPLGAGDPLPDRGFRDQEGLGDLRGGEPAHHPQGQGDLGGPRQCRVAAGEDQPEPVAGFRLGRPRHQREPLPVAAVPAQHVQAAAAGHRIQPGVRPVRDALGRPVVQRRFDRVLDQVFGRPEVSHQVDQRRRELARVASYHPGQLGVRGV